MGQNATFGNWIISARRRLHPIRRRISLEICKIKVKRLPAQQTMKQVVDFALRDRAINVQQVRSEIMELARLVAEAQPRTIVEIGTSRGGSLFILCRLAPPNSTIVSIDMPGAGFGEAYTSRHVELFKLFQSKEQSLHVLTADSHCDATRNRVEGLLNGERIDLLFIDGDHSYEGVKKDFDMYSPLVSNSGIIVFHDIAESLKFPGCEVKRFWDEIKTEFRRREIIADPNQGWAGIGVLWNDARQIV